MDPLAWLRQQLDDGDPDLVREMERTFAEQLMSAEVDALAGATYGALAPDAPTAATATAAGAGTRVPGRSTCRSPTRRTGRPLPGILARLTLRRRLLPRRSAWMPTSANQLDSRLSDNRRGR